MNDGHCQINRPKKLLDIDTGGRKRRFVGCMKEGKDIREKNDARCVGISKMNAMSISKGHDEFWIGDWGLGILDWGLEWIGLWY